MCEGGCGCAWRLQQVSQLLQCAVACEAAFGSACTEQRYKKEAGAMVVLL